MSAIFRDSLVRLGAVKVIRGTNFLFPVNSWGESYFCFRIDLEITVTRAENESLNLKSPTPRGFYGYLLRRINKTPIEDVIPISFRNQRINLFDSYLTSYPSLWFGFLAEVFGSLGGLTEPLTQGLRNSLEGLLPKPPWTNVLIKAYASTIRARLIYYLLKFPDLPFLDGRSPQDLGGIPPSEESNLIPLSEIPDQITIENSSFGGDFSLGTPESLLGLKFQYRDVVNGVPRPWEDVPAVWGVFDLPFVFSEDRGGGQCFKQVRTRISNQNLSPGGIVPCDTWQVELRVVPS